MEAEPLSPLRSPTVFITGHNSQGQAIIHSSTPEGPNPYPGLRTSGTIAYTTSTFPPDLTNDADLKLHSALISPDTNKQLGLVNPGGTVCRIVDFAPNNNVMMHRTRSLDYGVVLEGEMVLELDDGSRTRMVAGDIAVQRGTMHSWRNVSESGQWARMLFVLQEAVPLTVNGTGLGEELEKGQHVKSW